MLILVKWCWHDVTSCVEGIPLAILQLEEDYALNKIVFLRYGHTLK